MSSNDFSLFALFTAGLAALTTLVQAQGHTAPVDSDPVGNPIYLPNTESEVVAGQPFEITWDPTTPGTVTLVLLRGPSTDLHEIGVIANQVENRKLHLDAGSVA